MVFPFVSLIPFFLPFAAKRGWRGIFQIPSNGAFSQPPGNPVILWLTRMRAIPKVNGTILPASYIPRHFVPGIIPSKIFRALRFGKSRLIMITQFFIYYGMQNTAEYGRIRQSAG
jgi:hypothetical protein